MLKISTRGTYAVRIMVDLAQNYSSAKGQNVKLKDIAKRQGLPRDYIAHLILELKNANLVKSFSGKDGGHMLAKSPDEISMLDILESVMGPVSILECLSDGNACDQSGNCCSQSAWRILNNRIVETTKEITLTNILANNIGQPLTFEGDDVEEYEDVNDVVPDEIGAYKGFEFKSIFHRNVH